MSQAAVSPEARPEPPTARLLRWGLWSLLLMVVGGLGVVWAVSGRAAVADLPVLGRVPDFDLVDQRGEPFGSAQLAGLPWVADLVFTRCQISCPQLTARMAALGEEVGPGVRRVSLSIDPSHDTPEVLAQYVRDRDLDARGWSFLTGDPAAVRRLAGDGFHLAVGEATEAAEEILHSNRFVLVDGEGRVRGYYDPFEPASFHSLVRHANALARG